MLDKQHKKEKYLKKIINSCSHDEILKLYISAINQKNLKLLKYLIKFNTEEYDFIRLMYNENGLSKNRLKFILRHQNGPFRISKDLIQTLIDDYSSLLDTIFKNFHIYDINFILDCCLYYKNKIPLSSLELCQKILKYEKDDFEYYLKDFYDKSNGLLLYACHAENELLLKCLIQNELTDCENNKYDKYDMSPLCYACEKSNETIVKHLIDYGFDVNDGYYYTPLISACKSNKEKIVKCLIEHGADVNKASYKEIELGGDFYYKKNKYPLTVACKKGNEGIVKCLIENGANGNISNLKGETPLLIACGNNNEGIVKYLIENIKNIDDREKNEALYIACKNRYETIVKILIKHNANVKIKMKYEAPIILSCEKQ